ncbi:hypothetical protein BD309DRAFT_195570 [Dichomitus squalens]|nr:hypothetical protein BD309DRAFT_195570 [Dichomitus squalens]
MQAHPDQRVVMHSGRRRTTVVRRYVLRRRRDIHNTSLALRRRPSFVIRRDSHSCQVPYAMGAATYFRPQRMIGFHSQPSLPTTSKTQSVSAEASLSPASRNGRAVASCAGLLPGNHRSHVEGPSHDRVSGDRTDRPTTCHDTPPAIRPIDVTRGYSRERRRRTAPLPPPIYPFHIIRHVYSAPVPPPRCLYSLRQPRHSAGPA